LACTHTESLPPLHLTRSLQSQPSDLKIYTAVGVHEREELVAFTTSLGVPSRTQQHRRQHAGGLSKRAVFQRREVHHRGGHGGDCPRFQAEDLRKGGGGAGAAEAHLQGPRHEGGPEHPRQLHRGGRQHGAPRSIPGASGPGDAGCGGRRRNEPLPVRDEPTRRNPSRWGRGWGREPV
ncbi:unnamed protein product, partial [Ectocarpus sp. 12 AP-2014]